MTGSIIIDRLICSQLIFLLFLKKSEQKKIKSSFKVFIISGVNIIDFFNINLCFTRPQSLQYFYLCILMMALILTRWCHVTINVKSHDQDMKRAKALAWHSSFCIKWTYLRERKKKITWINVHVVLLAIWEMIWRRLNYKLLIQINSATAAIHLIYTR